MDERRQRRGKTKTSCLSLGTVGNSGFANGDYDPTMVTLDMSLHVGYLIPYLKETGRKRPTPNAPSASRVSGGDCRGIGL